LYLSNASGGVNPDYQVGDLMILRDHINLMGVNPLIGPDDEKLGPRFPDMSKPYSDLLNNKLVQIAKEENVIMYKGVYLAVMGPNLETRAEYRMLRQFADAVGMSTVPEVIVANHMKLPCAAISVLTDECDPDNLKPTTLGEIIEIASKAETGLIKLFVRLIDEL
jgi:purine-nucleoside phosphorylase